MKTLRLGAGLSKPTKGAIRLMFDIGLESTTPITERTKNIVAIVVIVAAFLGSIAAVHEYRSQPSNESSIIATYRP
jgi:hypothetical protein